MYIPPYFQHHSRTRTHGIDKRVHAVQVLKFFKYRRGVHLVKGQAFPVRTRVVFVLF